MLENRWVVKSQATGTLDEWLDDDAGDARRDLCERRVERRIALDRKREARGLDAEAREGPVQARLGIGYSHRRERIPVVGALEADNLAASGLAAIMKRLHRHLDRNF